MAEGPLAFSSAFAFFLLISALCLGVRSTPPLFSYVFTPLGNGHFPHGYTGRSPFFLAFSTR